MRTAAVILAAGASTRFGSPKQLARIGGRSMLEVVADVASEAGLHPVIAVVPPGLAVPAGLVPVVNSHPEAGISRSVRMGLAAAPYDTEAAVILLGDEPGIGVEAIAAVVDASGDLVATRSGDRVGPPVFLHRDRFGLAEGAVGDDGLGPVLRSVAGLVTVPLSPAPVDVDTPADLARIAHMFDSRTDR